ncbi:MAG: hypothetical protein KDK39_14360 [Leptospiraceae bacterium]|nr:hypothetical protein [Leptospiraceae bacterium]
MPTFSKELLPELYRHHLATIFGANKELLQTFYAVARDELLDSQRELLVALLDQGDFQQYLQAKANSTPGRFAQSLRAFLRRLSIEIHPAVVAATALATTTAEFRRIENSFFKAPLNLYGYHLFERQFIKVGEFDPELLGPFLEFCSLESFEWLARRYFNKPNHDNWDQADDENQLYREVLSLCVNTLLSEGSAQSAHRVAEQMARPATTRFLKLAERLKTARLFLVVLSEILHQTSDPAQCFDYLDILHNHYPEHLIQKTRVDFSAVLLERINKSIAWFRIAGPGNQKNYKSFLKSYGRLSDDFQRFIYDAVFDLEIAKMERALELFSSATFYSIQQFYSSSQDIIKMLIKNIITAISEAELRQFHKSLYPIVLKLFLQQKADKRFLKRRSEFIQWLLKNSSSHIIELEVIRLLIFEYIYMALGKIKNAHPVTVTMHCDEFHRYFCKQMDVVYADYFQMRNTDPGDVFRPVLDRIRDTLWQPISLNFGAEDQSNSPEKRDTIRRTLDELRSMVESTDLEDLFFASIEQVACNELAPYFNAVYDRFRNDPTNLAEALAPDFWYRVSFQQSLEYTSGLLLPILGSIDLHPGECGAYTDGHTIFLPAWINDFKDPLDPLIQNRNLAQYAALALHEAGHILAGSFRFDLMYYLMRLERPEIFKVIYNIFEDYRIEQFMIRIRLHHQISDLLDASNDYYSIKNLSYIHGLGRFLLDEIFNAASGFDRHDIELDSYTEKMERLLNSALPIGRFRSMKELLAYGVERLQGLELANPLAAYPLAREFYEIMKTWPDEELYEMLHYEFLPKGLHQFGPTGDASEGDQTRRQMPLNQNELDQLYRDYNDNPRKFLERYELPVFDELLPEQESPPGAKTQNGAVTTAGPGTAIQANSDQILASLIDVEKRIENRFQEYGYNEAGTIDFSTRTRADDLAAEMQQDRSADKKAKDQSGKSKKRKPKKDNNKKKKRSTKKAKKKSNFVYTLSPATGSRTRISEIREYPIKDTNALFMQKLGRWEGLSRQVLLHLARMIPDLDERQEVSSFEGDIDIERLLEVLSDKNNQYDARFLEFFEEQSSTLEVVIGLDASGSTDLVIRMPEGAVRGNAVRTPDGFSGQELLLSDSQEIQTLTVLDIEKAFALILGRAMEALTPSIHYLAFDSLTSTNIYRATSLEAVSSFTSGLGNRDGDFIRYVHNILAKSPADVKYFFMLSDGSPNSDNYSGKNALDDTLIAMREVVQSGIQLIYFNIDATRQEYFELFKREASYAEHFSDPEDLLPVIPEMVRSVVKSIR